jgi:hypothetical protein
MPPDPRATLAAKLSPPNPVPAASRAAPTRNAPRTLRPPAFRKRPRGDDYRRAGDRTRTGDVQLGKRASPTPTSAHRRKTRRYGPWTASRRQLAPGCLLPGTLPLTLRSRSPHLPLTPLTEFFRGSQEPVVTPCEAAATMMERPVRSCLVRWRPQSRLAVATSASGRRIDVLRSEEPGKRDHHGRERGAHHHQRRIFGELGTGA